MLKSQLESILFMTNKPLDIKELASLCARSTEEVETCLASLQEEYNQGERGVRLTHHNHKYQFITSGENREVVEKYLKSELTGELTRPQLETLTIICYRGPILKSELEQIRGVNCSLILRNLMLRGLVETFTDRASQLPKFQITLDFMKYLGIQDLRELPNYASLSQHESLEELLADSQINTDAKVEIDAIGGEIVDNLD